MTSPAFYVPAGGDRLTSTPSTAGPWGGDSQHGGPPAALLTRAVEQLDTGAERVVGRITIELLGPVPVGPLAVTAQVVRPGRTVEMCEAVLHDVERDRPVARATAWRFPAGVEGPGSSGTPLPHTHRDGEPHERPRSWSGGYLDAVDWRWVEGAVEEPGPGVVWMRPRLPLVAGEDTSPVQRLMACVDSASGVSAQLDPARWGFLNTELTVHVLRPPTSEWICLQAETTLGPGSVGMAVSAVYDEHGLCARSTQALLVSARR